MERAGIHLLPLVLELRAGALRATMLATMAEAAKAAAGGGASERASACWWRWRLAESRTMQSLW